jgi:hypothetical protein
MHSQYLNRLSADDRETLCKRLLEQQGGKCFICEEPLDLDVQRHDIDHIKPLNNGGKDDPQNFAVTHEACNRSKQDANLEVARALWKLKKIQMRVESSEHRAATLNDLLKVVDGARYAFKSKIENDTLVYSFDEPNGGDLCKAPIYVDQKSGERTCFIEVPIAYLYHDELINPRGINSSIAQLVKEFHKGNPQLHLTLARIDDGKIKVFDGQHKAAAKILLGERAIFVRLFVKPDVNRLIETNRNAGSSLRQIAFDKAVMRQLNDTLYKDRVREYQIANHLSEDDQSFSEQDLCQFFREKNTKKFITDRIKKAVETAEDNRLKDFIDYDGKAKTYPISYSTFDKVFLSSFISSKTILSTPIDYLADAGMNPRELEIRQISRLLSILADEIYIGKFNKEIGVYRLEDMIVKGRGDLITDAHLTAFRMSKEEVAMAWVPYLIQVIETYFYILGRANDISKANPFQTLFDEQLWTNLRNFIVNLAALPLWSNRELARSHFSGKKNADFWKCVFNTGKTPEGRSVLAKELKVPEMMQA